MADVLITLTQLPNGMFKVADPTDAHRLAPYCGGGVWTVTPGGPGPEVVQLRYLSSGELIMLFEDGSEGRAWPTTGMVWQGYGSSGGGPQPSGELIDWWTIQFGQGAYGDWESHASYSRGGTDWSTPMGFPLKAPAAGMLRNYPNEDAAGLKSMIVFDKSYPRLVPASPTLMNGVYVENPTAPAVAFVAQHLDSQTAERHLAQGDVFAYSGNSAGPGSTGDTHLHAQLLADDSIGADRLDFMKFRTEERES